MNSDISEKLPGTLEYTPLHDKKPRSLLVNMAPRESELELQLSLFSRENRDITFCFSNEPRIHPLIDLYLIPLKCLFWLQALPLFSAKSVFVYGPAYGLPGSFLAGCSDYLKEPWEIQELVTRARRFHRTISLAYSWGWLSLNYNECQGPGGSAVLSPAENTILRALIRNRQKRVERELLSYLLWGAYREDSRAVDMHIAKLRKKMKTILPPGVRTVILTCRPGGYMLR